MKLLIIGGVAGGGCGAGDLPWNAAPGSRQQGLSGLSKKIDINNLSAYNYKRSD
jgi:hypothetical protein